MQRVDLAHRLLDLRFPLLVAVVRCADVPAVHRKDRQECRDINLAQQFAESGSRAVLRRLRWCGLLVHSYVFNPIKLRKADRLILCFGTDRESARRRSRKSGLRTGQNLQSHPSYAVIGYL